MLRGWKNWIFFKLGFGPNWFAQNRDARALNKHYLDVAQKELANSIARRQFINGKLEGFKTTDEIYNKIIGAYNAKH